MNDWNFDLEAVRALKSCAVFVTIAPTEINDFIPRARYVYPGYVVDGKIINLNNDSTPIENEYWRIVAWMPWPEPAQDEEMAET